MLCACSGLCVGSQRLDHGHLSDFHRDDLHAQPTRNAEVVGLVPRFPAGKRLLHSQLYEDRLQHLNTADARIWWR